eukprot:TRINITY_DN13621_c0_g3_i1.p1 TRINITY_DN13621_c0_g3~~TRINITY_DN13621_c0_g3_i1.p1  ORF type:complete len:620 (+),score=99.16 TRINITY_DN13621_c0_g3_i1:50-1861(+)
MAQTPGRKSAFTLAKSQLGGGGGGGSGGLASQENAPSRDAEHQHPQQATQGDSTQGVLEWIHRTDMKQKTYRYTGGLKKIKDGDGEDPDTHVRHDTGEPFSKFNYPDGDYYEGEWKNGKRHGQGALRLANGYHYDGKWEEDTPTGNGNEGFTRHEFLTSTYQSGKPNGKGYLFYKPREEPKYRYHGTFRNGKRHGKGTIYYQNGDVYRGTWKDGKRDGRGVTMEINRNRKFATIWANDKLLEGPYEVFEQDGSIEQEEDNVKLSGSAGYAPADLTKWRVQEGVEDLTLPHFHRLNAGFELLDDDCSGELSTAELTKLWGSRDQQMLKRLDRNKDGQVSLYEILLEWYPSVRKAQLLRFIHIEPSIPAVHRFIGRLSGVAHSSNDGFMQVTENQQALQLKTLEDKRFMIGGEKFSFVLWQRARALRDPPNLLEVLEAWYPNTPRSVLERFAMARVPFTELEECYECFQNLDVKRTRTIDLDLVLQARAVKRCEVAKRRCNPPAPPIQALVDRMTPYFFASEPCFSIGHYIKLTVPMLEMALDWASPRMNRKRQITFHELIQYSFPNLSCIHMQHSLAKRQSLTPAQITCACDVCEFCRGKGLSR